MREDLSIECTFFFGIYDSVYAHSLVFDPVLCLWDGVLTFVLFLLKIFISHYTCVVVTLCVRRYRQHNTPLIELIKDWTQNNFSMLLIRM